MYRSICGAGLVIMLAAAPTLAWADGYCETQASDKKLSGAAKTSFMKKCEADSVATCDKKAADKKLSGAAKTSFTKKCLSDPNAS